MSRIKIVKILIPMLILIFLVGCNKEELEPPEVKRYDSILFKEDYSISDAEATLDDPVEYGELAHIYGEVYHTKNETYKADFGVEIDRVYRGDAAANRLFKEDLERKIKKGYEWIMVVLDVYNFSEEVEDKVYFNRGEFFLYTSKGKKINLEQVDREDIPERVMVYMGESKKITLTALVKKKMTTDKLYVGIDKLKKEYEEDTKVLGDEGIEGEEGNVGDIEEDKDLIKYLSLKGAPEVVEFYGEDGDETDFEIDSEQ